MLNRKTTPPIVDTVNIETKLPPCEKYRLDNGVEVYAINAGEQDVLMLEFVFYAGNSYEDTNLVSSAANYLIKNGTKNKTAFQINEHFEYYGAYLNRACYNETATVTLHSLNKHIETLLPAMQELFTEAVMPEEELSVFTQNMKQRLSVNLKKCEFIAGRLIDEYIFGKDHPYGKYSSHEEFDALHREQLTSFYNQFYKNGKCVIFAAGKLPANFAALLNKFFGCLPFSKPERKDILFHAMQPAGTPGQPVRIENDPRGLQGAIRIGRSFPNRHHPDFIKMQVLNNIYGGFFGSRLMSNIREDKGYTYGIYSYLQNHIQESAFVISTEAGKEVCEATIKEIYIEMKKLQEEPVQEDELKLVKNYIMGTVLADLDGPFQILGRWKNLVLHGLEESYFYNGLETIRTISSEELQELAKKYFNPENFYELVVV